jgi:hypothetical protein
MAKSKRPSKEGIRDDIIMGIYADLGGDPVFGSFDRWCPEYKGNKSSRGLRALIDQILWLEKKLIK